MEPINVNLASETLTGKRHAPVAGATPATPAAGTTTAGTVERVTLRVILYAACVYSVLVMVANESAAAAIVSAVTLAGLACSARG